MPVHPQAQAFIDQVAGGPTLDALPIAVARESLDTIFEPFAGPPAAIARTEDRRIAGPAGDLPVRVYTPHGAGPHPVVVFLHGGGWVLGSLTSHDSACRAIAAAVPCVVVAVDYRLAPEHPYPAACEDGYAAVRWVASDALGPAVDTSRIAVAGDSAGGNLAAVVALMARDRGGPSLRHQVLIYPVTDGTMQQPSQVENGEGYFLSRDTMAWFWAQYTGTGSDRQAPYASPLGAPNLADLPSATVITAEFDPLRDEGEAYARRLQAAGVSTTCTRYDGMIHGFFVMFAAFDAAREALDEVARALRNALAPR